MLIGELARRTGLKASTLRYYEREGLLPPPPRSGSYDPQVLGRLNIIQLARSAGFFIAETRVFVTNDPGGGWPSDRWSVIAQRKTQQIDALIEKASQMKRLLTLSFKCRCSSIEDCERRLRERGRPSLRGTRP